MVSEENIFILSMNSRNSKENDIMEKIVFKPQKRIKKVLFSKNLRELIIARKTTIIEQRLLVFILSSLREEQAKLIEVKNSFQEKIRMDDKLDEYFQAWNNLGVADFVISFAELNFSTSMRNDVIQQSLINMANVNWFRLRDQEIKGYEAVPFILRPRWNGKHIFFQMDKAVIRILLHMHNYTDICRNLPFNVKSVNSLRFALWFDNKTFKKDKIEIEYHDLLNELYIPFDKYESRYKFERDYLIRVKAELDSFNDTSFEYEYLNRLYYLKLIKMTKPKLNNQITRNLNLIKTERTLKYLKDCRKIDNLNFSKLKSLFNSRGYEELAPLINRKIDMNLMNEDYVKAVFELASKKT